MPGVIAPVLVMLTGIALLAWQGYSQFSLRPGPPQPAFADMSGPAGVGGNRLPGIEMNAGQAWGDYDNDGWVDLYVTDPGGPNTLYRNNGDGTFSVSSLQASVALAGHYSAGATFADYDNDGWRDLFVAGWGPDHLFHNDQGQGFTDVTRRAGIADHGNSKTASWGDFDHDGWLDLYIANWSCYPLCGRPMDGDTDRLYRNNGDGTFRDVSAYLGGSLHGAGFVASFNDYDNDGDADLYLVNDEFINPIGNKLWRNDGPGCLGWCFTQVAAEAGAGSRLFGMGLALGDYDNDGDVDYYYSNVGPMELLQNQGDGTFVEVAKPAGVQAPDSIGWGAVFVDYDNDGWRDLYLAVSDTTHHKDIAANKLFRNNADGTFTPVACHNEAADVRMSLGVAYADYDRDGWVDLVVGNLDEGYRLYRNQVGDSAGNRWLAIELVGAGPVNRDAVGARATVTTPDGTTQMQEVVNGSSLGGGNELVLYFGLGQAASADVAIRWPDGTQQSFTAVRAGQRYSLHYPLAGETTLQAQAGGAAANANRAAVPELVLTLPLGLTLLALGAAGASAWAMQRAAARAGWGLAGLGLVLLAASAAEPVWPRALAVFPDLQLAYLMGRAGVRPPTNPPAPPAELVKLGEALFWDPELSGNRDIACATCHHPAKATGDNLSVSIGTGGTGLGEVRVKLEARHEFIPRNAQPLFNLGYEEWTTLFWDGRVFELAGEFHTPASDRLPDGLDSLMAAQAMFPVTSRDEMRGLRGDHDVFGRPNELAMIPDYTARAVWKAVMQRLMAIPGYTDLFAAAYPNVPADQLGFQHAANALAAYQIVTFTFEDSPFDRYLRGELAALSAEQKRGAALFYGQAGCSACHAGGLLTDQKFYNLAVPQIGDGKGREQPLDLGLARETGNDCDRYAFRTPPLRNVAVTGPWMHNGAFTTLEAAVRHHFDPAGGLLAYDPAQLAPGLAETCQNAPEVLQAILATQSDSPTALAELSETEVADLIAFLGALTSPASLDLSHTIPASVPSGLPVGGSIQNTISAYRSQRTTAYLPR